MEAAEGVYIYMRSDRFRKMRWSNVKDVLWSLREYMVVEGHAVRTAFAVTEAEGGGMLGFGQVLEGGPRMRASDGGMMSGTVSCV